MNGKCYALKKARFAYRQPTMLSDSSEYIASLEDVQGFKESLHEILILVKVNSAQCQGLIQLVDIAFNFKTKLDEQLIVTWMILPFYEHGNLDKLVRSQGQE